MGLDAISGVSNFDSNSYTGKQGANAGTVQTAGTVNYNINEVQETAKSAQVDQTGSDQQKGQNKPVSQNQIKDAITKANNTLKEHRTRCEFSYHEETQRVSIKIIDQDTDEVIKEIPPKETLDMLEKMWELAGLLFDEKR